MTSKSVILASTYHDPQFKLKPLLIKALPILKKFFKKRTICLTPSMNKEIFTFFKNENFIVIICPSNSRVETYSLAYKIAIEQVENALAEKIMYIDFDRLIHWINNFPDEIQKILNLTDIDNLHVGRTSRAFETHPITQKETEIIVNEYGSKVLGFNATKDIISVCHIITKELAIKILSIQNKTDSGFYCSWPILLWSWAESKRYIEVEGLEWETPDRYRKDIDNNSYEKWLKDFINPSEWRVRIKILHDCLIELLDLSSLRLNRNDL